MACERHGLTHVPLPPAQARRSCWPALVNHLAFASSLLVCLCALWSMLYFPAVAVAVYPPWSDRGGTLVFDFDCGGMKCSHLEICEQLQLVERVNS